MVQKFSTMVLHSRYIGILYQCILELKPLFMILFLMFEKEDSQMEPLEEVLDNLDKEKVPEPKKRNISFVFPDSSFRLMAFENEDAIKTYLEKVNP